MYRIICDSSTDIPSLVKRCFGYIVSAQESRVC